MGTMYKLHKRNTEFNGSDVVYVQCFCKKTLKIILIEL